MVVWREGIRAGGGKADGAHAVVHQFTRQLSAGHVAVADGEIEAVGDRLVTIHAIDDAEAVTSKDFFQFVGALAIDDDVVTEVVLTVAGSVHDGCKRILGAVARAR